MNMLRPIAIAAALALPMWFAALAPSCRRHGDIRDEPDSSLVTPPLPIDAGMIVPVDVDLGSPPFKPCSERPLQSCYGTVDFPCGLDQWVSSTAKRCQNETGCKTNGDLAVTLGKDGCVAAIGMNQPNDAFVKCLVAELGTQRCNCMAQATSNYFFGLGNKGCGASCSGEFPCPAGQKCVDAHCVTN